MGVFWFKEQISTSELFKSYVLVNGVLIKTTCFNGQSRVLSDRNVYFSMGVPKVVFIIIDRFAIDRQHDSCLQDKNLPIYTLATYGMGSNFSIRVTGITVGRNLIYDLTSRA